MKKIIALLLVVALTAALSVSLTMAYLQDTDEDVNVMTLGNVYIEQHEYQRVVDENGDYKTNTIDNQTSYVLEPFKQGKPLYPIVGDPSSPAGYAYAGFDTIPVRMSQVGSYGGMDVFAGKNAQDKFVTVENTGKSAAYVRTLVALEIGDIDPELLGTSHHKTWTNNYIGVIKIDGNKYSLTEYVYAGGQLSDDSWRHENGILPAGDTSYPNLCQVYLGADATNEDVAKLDGNKNGTFDILVLSQAVQAEGFETAEDALNAGFGDITVDNHPWVEKKVVTSANSTEDLADAVKEGYDTIVLGEGTYKLPTVTNDEFTIIGDKDTVIDLTMATGQSLSGTDITFEGVTVQGINQDYKGLQHTGNIVYNNVTFNESTNLYGESVTFNNCTFNLTSRYIWTYGAGEVTFNNCTFNTQGKAVLIYAESSVDSQTVNFRNCTFNATTSGYTSSSEKCAAIEIDSSLITGTYTINFEGNNTVDSDFAGLYRIKKNQDPSNVIINGVNP